MNTEELKQKVKDVLLGNMITGYSKSLDFHYCYTKPSKGKYPFQYFWDTCLHVYMLLSIGKTDHARHHMESLFAAQQEDGFIGNIIYWKRVWPARLTDFFQMKWASIFHLDSPHMSNILQPPMPAQAVFSIYEKTKDKDFVKKMIPKLKKYYNWLADNRDFDGDYLLSIITSFESGMDWKPTFDPVVNFRDGKANFKLFLKMVSVDFRNFLRNYNLSKIKEDGPFRVKEVCFNSIYARNLYELSRLCEIVNEGDSVYYKSKSDKVVKSIMNLMYDEQDGAFYDLQGKENTKLRILTPTIFYPLILDKIPRSVRQKVMDNHFFHGAEFDTPFPVPSLAKNDPAFYPGESIYIWRGPTWILNNWILHKYLLENGHPDKAKALMESVLSLIEKSGFREYYNPFTGGGLGAKEFTWAGLVLDMIENEEQFFQKSG